MALGLHTRMVVWNTKPAAGFSEMEIRVVGTVLLNEESIDICSSNCKAAGWGKKQRCLTVADQYP